MRFIALVMVMLLAAVRMPLAAETQAAAPAQQEAGYFVVSLAMVQEPTQDQAGMEALMGHIGHLTALYDQGVLFMAGPFDEGGHEGLSIVKAHSEDEAKSFFSSDPCVASGMMQITAVHPWWAAYSRPDNQRFSPEMMAAMMSGEDPGAAAQPATDTAAAAAGDSGAAASASSSQEGGGMMPMTPGGVNFIQIPASDPAASQAFYTKVFGWDCMVEDGTAFFTAPGGMMGEFTTELKPAAAHTGATFFINCESVAAKVGEITAAGGMVFVQPMALPNGWGHIAIFGDVAGNAVGIWSAGE